MKKNIFYCLTLIIFLLFPLTSNSQTVDVEIKTNGDTKKETFDLPVGMTYPLDSLLQNWHIKTDRKSVV